MATLRQSVITYRSVQNVSRIIVSYTTGKIPLGSRDNAYGNIARHGQENKMIP